MKVLKDRAFNINSEGEISEVRNGSFREVEESDNEALPALVKLWQLFADRFRNWGAVHKRNGSYSDTNIVPPPGSDSATACIMPCGYISKKDGKPRAWLQLEYASLDNGKITKETGANARVLRPRVAAMAQALSEEFPGLNIFIYAEWRGYYMLNLCGTEEQADRLYTAALRAAEMTYGDEVLYAAHEFIG